MQEPRRYYESKRLSFADLDSERERQPLGVLGGGSSEVGIVARFSCLIQKTGKRGARELSR